MEIRRNISEKLKLRMDGSILGSLKKKRIGVLMGGLSEERQISLKTGKAILKALLSRGYTALAVDFGRDINERLASEKIDLAYLALHGRYGEDGVVQGLLELAGIPYTGSGLLASALAMDKLMSKRIFEHAGLKTAPYLVYDRGRGPGFKQIEEKIGLPLVVKPRSQGSAIGVSIVKASALIEGAVSEGLKFGDSLIIEKYIAGKEVTLGMIGTEVVLPMIEIIPKGGEFYDFNSKYTPGMSDHLIPPRLPAETIALACEAGIRAYEALSCSGVSRVDLIISKEGEPFVLEVNTIPGMTETSLVPDAARAAGVDFPSLVEYIMYDSYSKAGR